MRGPTRLPDSPVRLALVSGEYPQLAAALARIGIKALPTDRNTRLPAPVCWHPDLLFCVMDGELMAAKGTSTAATLRAYGIPYRETVEEPGPDYPQDALCNVLAWDRWVIGNRRSADPAILQKVEQQELEWLSVRQGYTACSTALVDHASAITADPGVAEALRKAQMDVLLLKPGGIRLPGYPYGFIGGCCGKLAPNLMAFSGQISLHPEGEKIRGFLEARGIRTVELLPGELLDVGGIIPLA